MAPTPHLLESLVAELEQHPVNSNVFFRAFKDQYVQRGQLESFLKQYRYFCKHFVKLLEGLLYKTPVDHVGMRIELVKTLHSELGSGRSERAHIRLLDRFANALGLSEVELDRTRPIAEVETYMQVLHRLFIESDYLVALGAELAVEKTAASEFKYLYPGLKKYECFHDDLEFFTLHLKEEECHGAWLIEAVENTAKTSSDLENVAAGARETADAWHGFWLGLHREIFGPQRATTAGLIERELKA
jgi:pyrroloquinoline quinone (PQQ) biosynthesis protein C